MVEFNVVYRLYIFCALYTLISPLTDTNPFKNKPMGGKIL